MPPPGCDPGFRRSADGCSACGPGTFQSESDYLGELCTECPMGTFASGENATACEDCYKPICAKELTYCDRFLGNQQRYTFYDEFEAPNGAR